jgi:hypothetical protein
MLGKLSYSFLLLILCVVIHAAGVSAALHRLPRRLGPWAGFWWSTSLFAFLAGWMVLLHLFEICAWALLYVWHDAIGDLPSALYFSAVTYTTTGYGDIVLPPEWRLVGGVEALTGILMCGWSTGFFFAVVIRQFDFLRRESDSSGDVL